MERIADLNRLGSRDRPVLLAAGFLDGLHLGHQAVLRTTVDTARKMEAEAWVLTVEPHPMKLLHPERAPAVLTDIETRIRLISEMGLTGCAVLPFTREFSEMEPEDFLCELHQRAPVLRGLVVGQNWRFGHRACGDVTLLQKWAERRDLRVLIIPPVLWKGLPVSSSRIRQAIEKGDLPAATAMLGRPFSMSGTVIHGRNIGHQLGFPTANLLPKNEVRPAPGVYAVRISGLDPVRYGAAYYGDRPTFHDGTLTGLEVHILDTTQDLYGLDLEVHFLERLRGDLRFATHAALIEQIRLDVACVRTITSRSA